MSKGLGSRSSVRSLRDITRVDYKSLHEALRAVIIQAVCQTLHEATTGGQADSMPLQGASGGPDNILVSGDSPRAEYGFVDIDGVDDEFLAMQREMQQLKAEEVLLKRVTQKGTL